MEEIKSNTEVIIESPRHLTPMWNEFYEQVGGGGMGSGGGGYWKVLGNVYCDGPFGQKIYLC